MCVGGDQQYSSVCSQKLTSADLQLGSSESRLDVPSDWPVGSQGMAYILFSMPKGTLESVSLDIGTVLFLVISSRCVFCPVPQTFCCCRFCL